MERHAWVLRAALLAALSPLAARAGEPAVAQSEPGELSDVRESTAPTPADVIRDWPPASREAARAMLEKYGPPAQFDRRSLVWFGNGEWKRTVVSRRGPAGSPGAVVEQTIGYLAPTSRLGELKKFDPRLSVSPGAGELAFRSDSEATNRLALNLADEIATGRRTDADAREFFAKTLSLSAAGKSSPYTDRLLFDVDNVHSAPPTGGDR